jgi:GxxExxY protein
MLPIKQLNALTQRIIGCSIVVHRQLGPGLLECLYDEALSMEFTHSGLKFDRQKPVPIIYRGRSLASPLRLDFLVENEIIVEVKALETILPVHEAQLLSYLRLSEKDVGLLINFHVEVLKSGIRRKMRQFTPS